MRLTQLLESPDKFTVGSTDAGFQMGTAFSFVTPDILAITTNTHPSIFSAVRAYAGRGVGMAQSQSGKFGVFKDYHVRFLGGKPSHKQLLDFAEKITGETGQTRRDTQSGRVWQGIEDKDLGILNGVSFWIDHAELLRHPSATATVVGLFGLKGLTYVEAIDYKTPEIYGDQPVLQTMVSKVAPELSKDQIYDILIRAHTSPDTLSRREMEVAWEFRGKSTEAATRAKISATHGYPTDAEWRHRQRFSESIARLREFTLPIRE